MIQCVLRCRKQNGCVTVAIKDDGECVLLREVREPKGKSSDESKNVQRVEPVVFKMTNDENVTDAVNRSVANGNQSKF